MPSTKQAVVNSNPTSEITYGLSSVGLTAVK